MGISDHVTCLLRNVYEGQEATVRTWHEIKDWFKIGKGVHQGCILSPCLVLLFFLIYFNWKIITLQYYDNFCHTSIYISHRHTFILCILNPPPSHPTPPGCHRAPAMGASHIKHAQFILHIVIYMFQCYSLKSSHLLLLPLSSKVCSLYLCLFSCLAYKVIITIFLNSIYMH